MRKISKMLSSHRLTYHLVARLCHRKTNLRFEWSRMSLHEDALRAVFGVILHDLER